MEFLWFINEKNITFAGVKIENEININLTTGDVWSDKIVTNNMSVIVSTGDIDITNSKINNNLNIETSTGDVELRNIEIVNDKVENVIDSLTNVDLVLVDPQRSGLNK